MNNVLGYVTYCMIVVIMFASVVQCTKAEDNAKTLLRIEEVLRSK